MEGLKTTTSSLIVLVLFTFAFLFYSFFPNFFENEGQIELYTHLPVMKLFVQELQKLEYRICAVHLLDSHFITDASKFIAGSLMCLSAMVQLELPHINVLSKMDLVKMKGEAEDIERCLSFYFQPPFPSSAQF